MRKALFVSLSVLVTVHPCLAEEKKPAISASHQLATASIQPTQGNTVRGKVTFLEVPGGLRVDAIVTGLTPGKHGFHIHEKGDCSAPDGSSAGGHFNPDGHKHGAPHDGERHVGDMGNLDANAEGTATLSIEKLAASLGGPHSIVGRSIIVHADPDDFKTQPTGNAGGRQACGIIKLATSTSWK